jgi:hypothetical protein
LVFIAGENPTGDKIAGATYSSSGSRSGGGWAGVEMTYFPLAQLPRSISRHRSLQKGASGSFRLTDRWQIGHFIA